MVMIFDMSNGEVEQDQIITAPRPEVVEMRCPEASGHELELALVEVSAEAETSAFPESLKEVDMNQFVDTMEQSAGR